MAARLTARLGESLDGRIIGVWGLSFKPGTDDLREAPSLVLLNELLRRGAHVRCFDPVAMPGLASLWPDRANLALVSSPMEAAMDASALMVVTEWREFRSPDFAALKRTMKRPLVLDGRNLYEPAAMQVEGFDYVCVGRAAPGGFSCR